MKIGQILISLLAFLKSLVLDLVKVKKLVWIKHIRSMVTAWIYQTKVVYKAKKLEVLRNHPFLRNSYGATGNGAIDIVVAIAIGLFAVAYILPPAMSALGGANTTDWPTGTSAFIPVIGIFVMIALLIYFSKTKD